MQIKTGDVRVLASTSFHLVRKDWSLVIRMHAFKMLQVCVHMPLLFAYWRSLFMLFVILSVDPTHVF